MCLLEVIAEDGEEHRETSALRTAMQKSYEEGNGENSER
jgi:hypothetical protein